MKLPINKRAALAACAFGTLVALSAQNTPPPAADGAAGSGAGIVTKEIQSSPGDSENPKRFRTEVKIAQAPGTSYSTSGETDEDTVGLAADGSSFFWRGKPAKGKALVIRSSKMEEKTASSLDEDLNIMARVLDKSVNPRGEDSSARKAMGINVLTLQEGKPARIIYLEGYGALFLLNVSMPLMAPPAKPEEDAKAKESASSTWEEARGEIYGREDADAGSDAKWSQFGKSRTRGYDAKKVEALKDSLVEALKNATHIRNLKPEDWITVAVTGSSGAGRQAKLMLRRPTGSQFEDRLEAMKAGGDAPGETTLTLRVKKSDVDAFAKGTLNADEFRKKAAITVY